MHANSSGYLVYRRRDNGRTFVNKGDYDINSRWIVSYALYFVDIMPYKSNVFFGAGIQMLLSKLIR